MEKHEIEKIVKGFQIIKPTEAIKKIDFSKFPKEVREKINTDLKEMSKDSLDILEGSSTFKKWIAIMANLYPAAFGIKMTKKPVVEQKSKNEKVDIVDSKQQLENLGVRLSLIKKMISKERDSDKKNDLRIRMKLIEKMINSKKQSTVKKLSSGGDVVTSSCGCNH